MWKFCIDTEIDSIVSNDINFKDAFFICILLLLCENEEYQDHPSNHTSTSVTDECVVIIANLLSTVNDSISCDESHTVIIEDATDEDSFELLFQKFQ